MIDYPTFPRSVIYMNDFKTLQACDVRNSERCLLFLPQNECTEYNGEDGVRYYCCKWCNPFLGEAMAEREWRKSEPTFMQWLLSEAGRAWLVTLAG